MSYNISILDASGAGATVHVAPDRPTVVHPTAVATNHQGEVEWERHAETSATLARESALHACLADPAAVVAQREVGAGRFVGARTLPATEVPEERAEGNHAAQQDPLQRPHERDP